MTTERELEQLRESLAFARVKNAVRAMQEDRLTVTGLARAAMSGAELSGLDLLLTVAADRGESATHDGKTWSLCGLCDGDPERLAERVIAAGAP